MVEPAPLAKLGISPGICPWARERFSGDCFDHDLISDLSVLASSWRFGRRRLPTIRNNCRRFFYVHMSTDWQLVVDISASFVSGSGFECRYCALRLSIYMCPTVNRTSIDCFPMLTLCFSSDDALLFVDYVLLSLVDNLPTLLSDVMVLT